MKLIGVCLCVMLGFCSALASAEPLSLDDGTYIGIIEPRQLIKVGSSVWGIVGRISVDRGDRVRKGALIAELDSDVEKVEVKLAEARYEMALKHFNRQSFLQKDSLVSKDDYDQSEMEMELARLEVERRKLMLKKKQIASPVSGVVTEKLVSTGEYVYEQTPVMVIAQTDLLNVEVLLPITEYGHIKEGMKADVFPQAPIGGDFVAEVEVVDKVMNPASSTFGVRLKLANLNQTIPSGIKCTVRFSLDVDKNVEHLLPDSLVQHP